MVEQISPIRLVLGDLLRTDKKHTLTIWWQVDYWLFRDNLQIVNFFQILTINYNMKSYYSEIKSCSQTQNPSITNHLNRNPFHKYDFQKYNNIIVYEHFCTIYREYLSLKFLILSTWYIFLIIFSIYLDFKKLMIIQLLIFRNTCYLRSCRNVFQYILVLQFILVENNIMHKIPKCAKNNEGYIMCWTQNCEVNPTICKDNNCQCLISHDKCFVNIAVNTFFKHLNQLNKGVFDTNKLKETVRENLQKLKKQVNQIIDVQIQNIDGYIKNYESQESLKFKKLIEGNQAWTSQKIEYYLKLKQIKLKIATSDIERIGAKLKGYFSNIKDNLRTQIQNIMIDKQFNKYTFDYNQQFKGTDIQLKSLTNHSIQFQHKANRDKHQDIILPTPLSKTTKLFIHATNLKIYDKKPQWLYAGIINKNNINFNTHNYNESIAVITNQYLCGNMKKIQGNGIQQKNECLYELEYNKQSNYLLIKIGYNKYRLDNLPKQDYYVIIGMWAMNSMVRIYQ